MSTMKLKAKRELVYLPHPMNKYYLYKDYSKSYFVAENGSKYYYYSDLPSLKVGDIVFMVKRLNVPNHSMYWQYEIYQIKITFNRHYNQPQKYFGSTRNIVELV